MALYPLRVVPGPGPGIHDELQGVRTYVSPQWTCCLMDCRVKPGNDG
jgi:hypothetical protein